MGRTRRPILLFEDSDVRAERARHFMPNTGSHTPLEDRQARLAGAERGYIRIAKHSRVHHLPLFTIIF